MEQQVYSFASFKKSPVQVSKEWYTPGYKTSLVVMYMRSRIGVLLPVICKSYM